MAENSGQEKPRPVFLKIAPDISDGQAAEIVEIALKCNLSGLIISNTTLSRSGLKTDKGVIDHIGPGGLSGKPLRNRSTELLKFVAKAGGKRLVYIASGGIFSASDAVEKYEAGADLVQIYTGLIYEGPSLIRDINRIKS
jgi:dihydroorotate dehydrogenase